MKEIVNELKERESNILNDKKYAYYLNEEKYGLEVARIKNTEIEKLKQHVNSLIIVLNDNLLAISDKKITINRVTYICTSLLDNYYM